MNSEGSHNNETKFSDIIVNNFCQLEPISFSINPSWVYTDSTLGINDILILQNNMLVVVNSSDLSMIVFDMAPNNKQYQIIAKITPNFTTQTPFGQNGAINKDQVEIFTDVDVKTNSILIATNNVLIAYTVPNLANSIFPSIGDKNVISIYFPHKKVNVMKYYQDFVFIGSDQGFDVYNNISLNANGTNSYL